MNNDGMSTSILTVLERHRFYEFLDPNIFELTHSTASAFSHQKSEVKKQKAAERVDLSLVRIVCMQRSPESEQQTNEFASIRRSSTIEEGMNKAHAGGTPA